MRIFTSKRSREYSNRRSRRAMTMVEIMIASAIAVTASAAVMSVFIMTSRFFNQGFTETRIMHQTSLAVEQLSRTLNHAYRPDAMQPSYRPIIAGDGEMIEFSVPLDNGFVERRRVRFNEAEGTLHHEASVGGGFQDRTDGPILEDVTDFAIRNQEGILSFVITTRVNLARDGEKQFTMVGRALPRNL